MASRGHLQGYDRCNGCVMDMLGLSGCHILACFGKSGKPDSVLIKKVELAVCLSDGQQCPSTTSWHSHRTSS